MTSPGPIAYTEIRYRPTAGGEWITRPIPAAMDQLWLPGLDRGTDYTIQARNVGPTGRVSAWVEVTHTVAAADRGAHAPTGLAVVATNEGSALAWSTPAAQPADVQYVIQRAPDASGSPGTWADYATTKGTWWRDPAADSVVRWYRVRAQTWQGYASAYTSAVSSAGQSLTQAGSGVRVGDQRNLLPTTVGSIRSRWDGLTISYTVPSTGTSVGIDVTAATLRAGSYSLSYSASSATVTQSRSTTVTYQLYYLDASSAGGTRTLHTTTDPNDLANSDDVVWIGSVDITVPASGSGGSGGGDPGGGAGHNPL